MDLEIKEPRQPISSEDIRTGTSPEVISRAILDNLYYLLGRIPALATPHDWYTALAATVRDRLLENWVKSTRLLAGEAGEMRAVGYLSAEFLIGPQLGNTLLCLGITESVRQAVDGTGAGPGTNPGAGGGAGAGQRRSGEAGRLFHGFPFHAGDSGHRLRHSLRIRHIRPGDP